MKRHSQWSRFGFAFAGLKAAWQREASFRTEVILAGMAAGGLLALRAGVQPWLAWLLGTSMMLSVELVNTALEHICDALHPDQHPLIKIAKDTAAAAVLVVNSGVTLFFGIVLWRLW